MKFLKILMLFFLSLTISNCAENRKENSDTKTKKESAEMVRHESLALNQNMYVIEREIPGAGQLTAEELKGISQISCGVLEEMGSEIQWIHSYVTGDKIYCIYTAPNEEMVREHAKQGGFPANSVSAVSTVIGPSTAE
jgi:hypothetical protein